MSGNSCGEKCPALDATSLDTSLVNDTLSRESIGGLRTPSYSPYRNDRRNLYLWILCESLFHCKQT
jgi:hypothetical protein